jgi:hypothetical protein
MDRSVGPDEGGGQSGGFDDDGENRGRWHDASVDDAAPNGIDRLLGLPFSS